MGVSGDTGEGEIQLMSSSGVRDAPIIHSLVAGGLGGMCGDFFAHSIDTTKTRIQSGMHSTTLGAVKSLYREGIVSGFYRGIGPAMVGSLFSSMIYFGNYEYAKEKLLLLKGENISETYAYFLAGAFGDLTASVIYVPLEVAKTRMQLQGSRYVDFRYRNTIHALYSIYKREGIRNGLYSGLKATILRDMPFSAIQFTVYEHTRLHFISQRAQSTHGKGYTTPSEDFMAGGFAGAIAGFLTTPLDVIKTRLQTKILFSYSHFLILFVI
eukprot:Nk52_evm16s359 gene=Nk52_evmTU16s359